MFKVEVLLTDYVVQLDRVLALDVVFRMDSIEVKGRFLKVSPLRFDSVDIY